MKNVDRLLVLKLTNEERVKRKLRPLEMNFRLNEAAELQANFMASKNRLSHTSHGLPNGENLQDRIALVDYKNWSGIAENIAWNSSSEEVVEAWMNSPGHRRNILGDYNEIGVGIAINEKGEPYHCQVFGKTS
jgi:uncharacterized protein YkwD